jgi:limonene-1,2-epoxide hydrolase
MTDVVALSNAFVGYWNRRDIEAILGALAPDVVYQNVPLSALAGRDAVRAFITPNLTRVTQMHWVVHNVAVTAGGNKVLTERTDSFHFDGGVVHVPVMGIFEFRAGLIAARLRRYRRLRAPDGSYRPAARLEFADGRIMNRRTSKDR